LTGTWQRLELSARYFELLICDQQAITSNAPACWQSAAADSPIACACG
jgi:hypothetical protein